MKILYLSMIERNSGWGGEWYLNSALNNSGAQTIPLDYTLERHLLGDKFLVLDNFDVFFLQLGDYFPLPLVNAINRPRFFYCSELVTRYHAADHLFESGLFDHYFVRGPACARELIARGWLTEDKISTHLSAFDPETYQRINLERDIDVLFVGSLMPRRMKILEKLSAMFNVSVVSAYGKEACKFYNRAKIILNIHADDYLDTETRIFEVLGSGGFLITEKLSEENPFVHGELIEVSSIDEMEEKITYYIAHEEERRMIANYGYETANTKHTYLQRAKDLIDVFSKYLPVKEGPALHLDAVYAYARWKHIRRIIAFTKHAKWNMKRRLISCLGVKK